MKRFLFASLLLFSLVLSASANVNEKVLKAFNTTFQNAREVQWQEYATSYQVNFRQDDIPTSVVYDKQGNIIEARRYSKDDILPLMIREKLKKRFSDKQVWGVTETAYNGETTYRIILKDDKKWYILDCDATGVLTVRERFNKA